jgi:hypothetical protein
MLFIKSMRLVQVFFPDDRPPHVDELMSQGLSNKIIGVIAGKGSKKNDEHEEIDIEQSGRCQRAGGKEKGITGKERRDDQASLTKDNEGKDEVSLMMVLIHNVKQMFVDVKDKVDEIVNEFQER